MNASINWVVGHAMDPYTGKIWVVQIFRKKPYFNLKYTEKNFCNCISYLSFMTSGDLYLTSPWFPGNVGSY